MSAPLPSSPITAWLHEWRCGDVSARDRVLAAIYPQLRQIAARFLHRERAGHTLEPAALANELCLRMLGNEPLAYTDRAHLLAVAAQTMRHMLIDHARAKAADKRGGALQRVSLTAADGLHFAVPDEDLLELEQALRVLEQVDPRAAHVVELRFFGGMEEQEVAEVLGVSAITVKRDWKAARAWLIARLHGPCGEPPGQSPRV